MTYRPVAAQTSGRSAMLYSMRTGDLASSSRRVTASTAVPIVLALIALGLGAAHVAFRVLDRLSPDVEFFGILRGLFDLDYESNIPSWYSTALWVAAVVLAIRLGWHIRQERVYWYAIAAVSALLSLDESASLHERLEVAFGSVVTEELPGQLHFIHPWTIAAGLVALLVGLFLLRFVLRLPRHAMIAIILGGAAFVTGSLVAENVTGAVRNHDIPSTFEGIYLVLTLVEELLEMFGVILFIHALLWVGESEGIAA